MEEKYLDLEDELSILYGKLDEYRDINNAYVYFDEFSSFTTLQYNIIEKILLKAKVLSISLIHSSQYIKSNSDGKIESYSNEGDVFSVTSKTINKLIDIARKINSPLEYKEIEYKKIKRFNNQELIHLEKNLYAYPHEEYEEKTKKINININVNSFNEIEEVAKGILEAVRDRDFRYRDIAVVTRNLDSYDEMIKAIFNEYNIPYFIDKKKEIESNKLIVFLKSALEIISKNWSEEAVFKYLKSDLTSLSREQVDLLENYALANGIRGKRKWTKETWDYDFPKELSGGKEKEEILEEINELKAQVVNPLLKLYDISISKAKVKEISKIIFQFLQQVGAFEKIENWIQGFRTEGKQLLANEYSQIWNLIIETLDMLVEVLGDAEMSLEEYEKILSIGFEENKMGLIPAIIDQVLVGSVERSKTNGVKILYIIGVNDGVFPRSVSDEGILNDEDRTVLMENGITLASTTRAAAFEEQFLVYETFTAASDEIIISYPIADFEGKALRPSILVSRLKNIFKKITIKSDILDVVSMEKVTLPMPTFNQMISAIRAKMEGAEISEYWSEVYKWYHDQEEYKLLKDRIMRGFYYSNQGVIKNKEKIKKLYGEDYSVSRFETYVNCPFSYFVNYGLKAKERKLYNLTTLDKGTFLHNVIENFCISVIKEHASFENIDEDFCQQFSDKVLKETLKIDNSVLNSSNRYQYMANRLKKVLVRTLITITRQINNSDFKPISFEAEFDDNREFRPIEISLKDGTKAKIKGKIDRIDILKKDDELYIRIIDYKSSSKTINLKDVYYGAQLQLLVYLDAILSYEEEEKHEKSMPGAIFYYKIENPIVSKKQKLSDEEIEEAITENLKLKGLILRDSEIAKAMDKELKEGEGSKIIPVTLKKDGQLKESTSIATKEEFDILRNHVKKKLKEILENMINGDISIAPRKQKERTSCDYCKYSTVCQFDTTFYDNGYKKEENLRESEIWARLKEECGNFEEHRD